MAKMANMAAAGATVKPTIKAILSQDKDGLVIRIPGVVEADSIREKVNEETKKTTYNVVCLTYSPEGKAAPPVTLTVREGAATQQARFGLSTINLQFHGFVVPKA